MIFFNIYFLNNFNIPVKFDNYQLNLPNVIFNTFKWSELNNQYYLVDLVFPEYKLNRITLNKNNQSNQVNIWSNLSSRPFKICPCNYEKLLYWSNNSLLNICVFDKDKKIIGFCVVSVKHDCYFIDILCTNINNGIGTLIMDFIKNNFNNMPIYLKFTSNSKLFYLKKGFVISSEYSSIMVWNNYKKIEL